MSKQSHFARELALAKARATTSKHQRTLRALLVQHPAIKDAFQALPPALRADAWLSAAEYDDAVSIGLTLRDLPGFKAPLLQRALAPFLSPEWTASTQDYAGSTPNRDFKFSRRVYFTPEQQEAIERHPSARWLRANDMGHAVPTSLMLYVGIYAYVTPDSPTCRVVVTGIKEEVVRTEVKEIVCA